MRGPITDTFIELPHGGSGAGFLASDLVAQIERSGRDYIIQGQQHCKLENHTKPDSLDVWLRTRFTSRHDTAQGVNQVVDALVATGRFEAVERLTCPDTGRFCKGLRRVDPDKGQVRAGGTADVVCSVRQPPD